jgi:hypothetical protein
MVKSPGFVPPKLTCEIWRAVDVLMFVSVRVREGLV